MLGLLYIVGALLTWPLLAKAALKYGTDGSLYVETEDYFFATLMGGCLAVIWPLVIPGAVVLHVLRSSEVAQ